jgi:hypothetical protein
MGIILHSLPFEMMMICGAAIGAFACGNDMHTIKSTGKDLIAVFKGAKWTKDDYADQLCLMHELVRIMRDSPVDVEAHIEDPEASDLFKKYPKILAETQLVELICDTIRSMLMNFDDVGNQLKIVGHTDAHTYADGTNYSNWELSSDRANAARRLLMGHGFPGDQISEVSGKSFTEPLSEDPLSPQNRRISITLLTPDDK